ncbi:MAG: hypothetical protein PVF58_10260 [Candidatus Methanofastidiosia archaeon]
MITWRKRIGGIVTEHCLLGIKGRSVADFDRTCSGKKLDVFGKKNVMVGVLLWKECSAHNRRR